MDCAAIVLTPNIEGTKEAAGYMRSVLQDLTSSVLYVIAPDQEHAGIWTNVVEIGEAIYGIKVKAIHCETEAEGVNEAARLALAQDAEVLHVIRSDVQVSPVWRSGAANSRIAWSAVGPCGPQFSGSQFLKLPEHVSPNDFTACSSFLAGQYAGKYGRADWLDPECFALNLTKWESVGELDTQIGHLGWAMRDWCLRVRESGGRVAAIPFAFARILDPARLNPWQDGDSYAMLHYYEKHRDRAEAPQALAALFVTEPQSKHQLSMLTQSVQAARSLVDQIHVVLVDHPSKFLDGDGPRPMGDVDIAAFDGILAEPDEQAAVELFRVWLQFKAGATKVSAVFVPPGWTSMQQLEAHVTAQVRELGMQWCLRLTAGDLLEPVSREYLDRLMSHPDPMVVAYNVGISFTWDSDRLIREDRPFGDGGDLTGAGDRINDWRLYRTNGSRFATDGGRVANLRFRCIAVQNRLYRSNTPETGMRISAWSTNNRIGLHMLTYAKESADDLGRWLDWTHGLTDWAVLVWTGKGPMGATLQSQLVGLFGARVEHASPDVMFAEWRNTALRVLEDRGRQSQRAEDPKPLDWALFVDPDEWVTHQVHDLLAIRRMAEQRDRYAYMFDFDNHRQGGVTNRTSCVRMNRLHLGMKFDGKVHETFGATLEMPQRQYGPKGIAKAPFRVSNLATVDPEIGQAKLARYSRLIREELQENPHSSRHWILLSYQYSASGHANEARECLDRAIACGTPTAYLGYFDRAMLAARGLKVDLQEALRRLPADHHHHVQATAMLRSMEGVALAIPTAPGDDPEPLPPFPAE